MSAAAGILVLGATGTSSAAAPRPWWQVTTGSRPTNLWLPKSETQELRKSTSGFTVVQVEGKTIACMAPTSGECTIFPPYIGTGTAAQLQGALEAPAVYGTGNVEVTEAPVASGRFLIAGIGAATGCYLPQAPVTVTSTATGANAKVLTDGCSGRLVLTITNLGDAATVTPVTIADALPEGLSAYNVSAVAGSKNGGEPVTCTVTASNSVNCSFTGTLLPYEAIEVEVDASVTMIPPAPGALGKVTVSGGNAPTTSATQPVTISETKTPFGLEFYSSHTEEEGGGPVTQAGSHPFQMTTTIQLNSGFLVSHPNEKNPYTRRLAIVEQPAQPRNVRLKLPLGLVGNAAAVPRCGYEQFAKTINFINECPAASAIGAASVTVIETINFGLIRLAVPVFNLVPAPGEPARFGFVAAGVPVTLDAAVRSGESYRVTVSVANASQTAELLASTVSIWGVPGDPRHDISRGWNCVYHFGTAGICARPEGLETKPFLRLPTSCGAPLRFPLELEPWNAPFGSDVTNAWFTGSVIDGCSRVSFEPQIYIEPGSQEAETPSALTVHLKVPQEASKAPNGVAEADVQNTKVTLPAGLHINPAAANGLQACTEAQMGFQRIDPQSGEAVFNEDPASCPEASKLGKVKITTPLLEEPVTGWVYQAAQEANPFGSLLALYVVAEAPKSGIRVKLAGKVEANERTGQVVSTFDATPQLPFEEFELSIFGGSGAPLATSGCGSYRTETQIEPWSGGPAATPSSEFEVSGCSTPQPFAPSFSAGTETPFAGAYSPFALNLTRQDGAQQISRIDTVLPPGLTGKLTGIPYCRDADLAAAEAKTGTAELRSPSCPAQSQVGTVSVASGVGPNPYVVQGTAYLAGPYKGAPLSLAIITPAVAGPFDLGTVVVRTALFVNQETAQITAKSDPLPTMLRGIPLDVRSIDLRMDRPGFTLNPTNCEAMSLTGTATSVSGQAAPLRNRFQVGGCKGLEFAPKLKIQLKGATRRIGHPALKAVLTYPPGGGYANVARAQVNLPHAEFLDQSNLNKTCTKPVLLAGRCPASSVYGHAKAWTPLLEKPLEGNVYLVGGFGYKLPALVAELNGQIKILLVGKVDSGKNKGIRSTFEAVPDAPVSRFVLEMKGGKKYGLLENSENLCKATKAKRRAIARFVGQNGKVDAFKPVVSNQCKKRPRKARRAQARHRHRGEL